MHDLKNEFIFPPIKTGFSKNDGKVTEKHINFYELRSRFIGAVTLEPLYLHKGLREIPSQLGIDNDDKIEGLKELVSVIHKNGAKAIAHLNHPGRMANPKIPGNFYISSTDTACENGGKKPKKMNIEDMKEAVQLFKDAAIRAEKAGFDYIELQFGHGYLLAQFLSGAVNDRTDEFGGEFENRVRFPLMVLNGIKEVSKLPIIARISGDEFIPGGINISEALKLAKILEQHDICAIHVSSGSSCSTPPWFFQHMFVPKGKNWELASKIKEGVSLPVIFVGQINTFEDIRKLKEDYDARYIAVGRALVADPFFIGKYLGKVSGIPRPCASCSEGCLGGVKSGVGLQCMVNPLVGMEKIEIKKADTPKNIAIVGGGLSGMQAAITLTERGHSVTIFEKNRLGGQFNFAYLPPHKENLKKIVEYFEAQVKNLNIPVIFKEVKEEDLLNGNFDTVILATGSVPAIPPIKGLENYMWAEVLNDENFFDNKNVVIIGGGLIGIEVAHKLVARGNRVTIVEMLDEVARGMEIIEKKLTLKRLQQEEVRIYLEHKVVEVSGSTVYLESLKTGEKKAILNVDHIIVATGMKSYNPLFDRLKGKIPLYVIGDAKKVGKAKDAIKSGFEIGILL